ncbi:MAG TPA: phosphoribosyltransferase family protein [Acidimicrobiia bacterium]
MPTPLVSEHAIDEAVRDLARRLRDDYRDSVPLLVGVLKGSFVFIADLVRELGIPCEIDFVRARSYGGGQTSAGAVEITKDVETRLEGRHIVVVEDIADTGLTMEVVFKRIQAGHPASVRRCALFMRQGCDPPPDYVGIELGPGFVVGYGIDLAERHRELREIYRAADIDDQDSR